MRIQFKLNSVFINNADCPLFEIDSIKFNVLNIVHKVLQLTFAPE